MRSFDELRRFARLAGAGRYAAWLLLSLAAVQVAHAQTAVDAAYDRFRGVITGNSIAVGYGSNGTALAVPKDIGMGHVAKGLSPTAAEVSRYAALTSKHGQVPFKVSQTISAARLAKGLSAVAGGPLGIGLFAVSEVADWFTDAGIVVDSSTGQLSQAVQTRPCRTARAGAHIAYASTCLAAAQATRASMVATGSTNPGYIALCSSTSVTTVPSCGMSWTGAMPLVVTFDTTFTGTATTSLSPITSAQAETKLNATPRTAAELEQLVPKVLKYPEVSPDPAESVRVDPVTSGETVKSPTSTSTKTTTNPDGSTSTETTNCYVKGTPFGSSLRLSEVCSTQVVNTSPSGSVTGTSTSVVESGQPEDSAPQGEDSDFCASLVGKLICADLDAPEEDVPERQVSVQYNPLNLFGAGTCPAPRQYTSVITGDTHTASFQPVCDALSLLRPMFLAIAAFIGYMILLPKGND